MIKIAVRNYTTSIKPEKTIAEIEQILVKFGAEGIYKEYANGKVIGLMFYILNKGEKIPFKLPMVIEKCRSIINKALEEKKLPSRYYNEPLRSEQGERVAWRIIKDWIDSQLSLFQINFADAVEILFPYAYNAVEDKTMYQKFIENKEKYLALEEKVRD